MGTGLGIEPSSKALFTSKIPIKTGGPEYLQVARGGKRTARELPFSTATMSGILRSGTTPVNTHLANKWNSSKNIF